MLFEKFTTTVNTPLNFSKLWLQTLFPTL